MTGGMSDCSGVVSISPVCPRKSPVPINPSFQRFRTTKLKPKWDVHSRGEKIGLVLPVKPSNPRLENDPAGPLAPHHLRISPWPWFRPAHAVEKARKDIRLLHVGFLPQRHSRCLPGPDVQSNERSGHGTGAHFHGAHEETRHCPVMVAQPPAPQQQGRLLAPEHLAGDLGGKAEVREPDQATQKNAGAHHKVRVRRAAHRRTRHQTVADGRHRELGYRRRRVRPRGQTDGRAMGKTPQRAMQGI